MVDEASSLTDILNSTVIKDASETTFEDLDKLENWPWRLIESAKGREVLSSENPRESKA
jgi:hypothetical protein